MLSNVKTIKIGEILLAFVLLISLIGCKEDTKNSFMSLSPELSKVTTRCIGRFLVDIPQEFELMPGSYAQFYYGLSKDFLTVEMSVLAESGAIKEYESQINKRLKELTSTSHPDSPSKNMLAFQDRISENIQIIREYDDADSLNTFKAKIYALKSPATILLKRDVFKKDIPKEIEADLLKIADQTLYADPSKSIGRGACLGPVVVNAHQDAEIMSPVFASSKYKDVKIGFNMNSIIAESDGGLFARIAAKADLIARFSLGSTTIRKDKIFMGGRPAEEILESGKDHGKVVRSFTAETVLSTPSTFGAPLISIDMSMGGQVGYDYQDASLTQDQAVALWDAIIKSIRLRPGAL